MWGRDPQEIKKSLHITEKAVAAADEDAVTMAYQSAAMALDGTSINKEEIGCMFFGSESFPYAVKPAATIVAEWLGIGHHYLAYDTQFACKAGTGALISALAMVGAGKITYGLVCAGDKGTARPQDLLEYTAGSGANAWLVGDKEVILEVIATYSFSSDTPDFWRGIKSDYPSYTGRFTGQPAYFHHVGTAAKNLMAKQALTPNDFAYAVFHMPNGKFPLQVGLSLGFSEKQVTPSLVVNQLGNSYSASSLMGLAAVLDEAKAGDKILFVSYGSGAGSDAFIFQVTRHLKKQRKSLKKQIQQKKYINYPTYLKYMDIIHEGSL